MQISENFFTKKSTLIGIAIILFLMLCAAYANHFTNTFEFDDTHTIVNNVYIRNIKNLPLFFTDVKYFGTNVGNLGYRPVLVALNAIDFWLAGGLNPVYFHADIFLSYIVLLVLLWFLYKKIYDSAQTSREAELKSKGVRSASPLLSASGSGLIALLAVGFYGLHTANAETINYIIQRSDSFSALLIVVSLLLYIIPQTKKYYLYLFTILIAILTKEVGVVTGPLIFFYILFFEENTSLFELITFRKFKNSVRTLKKSLPAIFFSWIVLSQTQFHFVEGHTLHVNEELPSALNYYSTQAVVIAHYISNFILPMQLSASSNFTIFSSVFNPVVFFSILLCLVLVIIAIITSGQKQKRPIAFGIVWFFLTLAPSSFQIKNGELANDHRTFLPYIGLVMSLAWWLRLLYIRYASGPAKHEFLPKIIALLYFIIISLHAYGIHQRNIVWSSFDTLWYDAVSKNPDDSMAQLNYGVILMDKAKYNDALACFERVLRVDPDWAYAKVNMGILKDAMGMTQEADSFYRSAIQSQPFYPIGYYQYGRFLLKHGKIEDARAQLEAGLKSSPGDAEISELLNSITPETISAEIDKMVKKAEQNPTVENYLNLSLFYYQNKMYKECIDACEKVLKLDPLKAMAYNNIGAAYNALGQWVKAEEACNKALQIDPNLQLAKGNLNIAEKNMK